LEENQRLIFIIGKSFVGAYWLECSFFIKYNRIPPCVPTAVAAAAAVEVEEADDRAHAFGIERRRRTSIQAFDSG